MFKISKPHLCFIRYHLKDVIVGKIYFLLVRIKIKHMEIDIIKRETTGTGPSIYHENDTIAKYEIMDGAPVRGKSRVCAARHFAHEESFLICPQPVYVSGESIPIRLFLAGYDLTPTMRDINKKFSVRYYLNLVLIDEEERRYFKQQVREDGGGPACLSPCLHHVLLSGNHTMEERRRGEEKHVPSGRRRLSEVRGVRGFGERARAGRQGRERLDTPPPLRSPLEDSSASASECPRHPSTSGEAAVFAPLPTPPTHSYGWDEEGRLT